MRLTAGGEETFQYWKLPDAEERQLTSASHAVDEFQTLFADSVRLHLSSDVPVGTCLSGGLDSSAIVSQVGNLISSQGLPTTQIGDRQKTFSAVYGSTERFDEKPFVDLVLEQTEADGNFVIRLWSDSLMICDDWSGIRISRFSPPAYFQVVRHEPGSSAWRDRST